MGMTKLQPDIDCYNYWEDEMIKGYSQKAVDEMIKQAVSDERDRLRAKITDIMLRRQLVGMCPEDVLNELFQDAQK